MPLEKVNLAEKFAQISDYWNPRIAGELNDFAVKLVKLHGEFIWHHHDAEDELFLVITGRLLMKLRDGDVVINAGEFLIVPHGVEHMPVAADEVELLLLERKSTINTGNQRNERTVIENPRI